jgi:tRNA-modifying protein YgfZ
MTAVYVEEGPDKGAIWHFGEPNKEQKALLEEGKAWADLSHLSVIAVSGEDRLKWLHDLTTQYLLDFQAWVFGHLRWFLIRKDMLSINLS